MYPVAACGVHGNKSGYDRARGIDYTADVDRADARMRIWRAQHMGMGETRQDEIVGIAAATGQQARILGARHRLAQREFHCNPSERVIARRLKAPRQSQRDCFVAPLLAMTTAP